uniref:Uncharacterized protein n=1 Tax=Strigamia maritima TaxID=126957 RepID=T1IJY5_STRMM
MHFKSFCSLDSLGLIFGPRQESRCILTQINDAGSFRRRRFVDTFSSTKRRRRSDQSMRI